MGARKRVKIGLSYRSARQHSLAELVHWNQFLGSLKFKNSSSGLIDWKDAMAYTNPEAVFKEKRGIGDPMLQLTITSPYLIVDSEVQLSIPTTTNSGECFLIYSKIEQPIGNGRERGRGGS
jgi:hypothetical protein